MAFSPYLHGIEVSEEVSGSLPIQTIRTAVIGLIGTSQKGTANKVQLIASPRDAEDAFGSLSSIRKAIESKEDEARKKEASISKATDAAEIGKLKGELAKLNADIVSAKANLGNPKLYTLEKSFEAIYLQGSPLIVALSVGTGLGGSTSERAYQLKDAADKEVSLTINGTDTYTVTASEQFTDYVLTVDPQQLGTTYDLEIYVDAANKSKVSRIADEAPELASLMTDLLTDLNAVRIGSIQLNATLSGNKIRLNPTGEVITL
jgi:phage tail sheath protein FI